MLCMGYGCHASASELNFRPFGASTGTFRGRVISVHPNYQKNGGLPPVSSREYGDPGYPGTRWFTPKNPGMPIFHPLNHRLGTGSFLFAARSKVGSG